jgi:hypothetical protein
MSGLSRAAIPDVVREVKVTMTMRYSSVRRTLQNILVPTTAAARDVVNAWWKAVGSQHVTDPNILCLTRDWNEYDITDDDDMPIGITEGMMIFLRPLNKTCPEVLRVTIRWDGFDKKGTTPFYRSMETDVHREEPRSHLLKQ